VSYTGVEAAVVVCVLSDETVTLRWESRTGVVALVDDDDTVKLH